MKGYKVVKHFRDDVYTSSCYAADSFSELNTLLSEGVGVIYRVGKKTVPMKNCGPLCVFTDLDVAIKYVDESNLSIFECVYEISDSSYVWTEFIDKIQLDRLLSYFNIFSGFDTADSVTLTKQVI